MDSPARARLRRKFADVPVGTPFQLVNSVMGAAVPGTPVYVKTGLVDGNARDRATGELVTIRDQQEVELLE